MSSERFVLEPLNEHHPVRMFSCEDDQITEYLQEEAFEDMQRNVARTFVEIDHGMPAASNVAGFFTLRADLLRISESYFDDWIDKRGSIEVPIVELVWLARGLQWRGTGVGDLLMIEALTIVKNAADCVGMIGLHLRTTPQGRELYERYDFQEFTEHPIHDRDRYVLSVETIRLIAANVSLSGT